MFWAGQLGSPLFSGSPYSGFSGSQGVFAQHVVPGVERVDVGAAFVEFGIEGEPEQAPVAVVVDVAAEVGEDRRRRIREVVEDFDPARLLGDEDAAVGREAKVGRLFEATEGEVVS